MVDIHRLPQHRVEPGRRGTLTALAVEPLGGVDHRLHVAALERRDEGHRRPGHRAERVAEVFVPLPLLDAGRVEIPLVDDKHDRLRRLCDRLGQLFVDLTDRLARIEKQEHYVCPANASLGAVEGIEIDVARAALRPPQARGVDGKKRPAINLEPHVDAVAGGARHRAGDHPLLVGQRVDERALADVAAAHHGELHLGQVSRLGLVYRLHREPFEDRVDERSTIPLLLGTHRQRRAKPEGGELEGLRIEVRGVGLVDHEQDGAARLADAPGHLDVGR